MIDEQLLDELNQASFALREAGGLFDVGRSRFLYMVRGTSNTAKPLADEWPVGVSNPDMNDYYFFINLILEDMSKAWGEHSRDVTSGLLEFQDGFTGHDKDVNIFKLHRLYMRTAAEFNGLYHNVGPYLTYTESVGVRGIQRFADKLPKNEGNEMITRGLVALLDDTAYLEEAAGVYREKLGDLCSALDECISVANKVRGGTVG